LRVSSPPLGSLSVCALATQSVFPDVNIQSKMNVLIRSSASAALSAADMTCDS
jgi:hypothetical protein